MRRWIAAAMFAGCVAAGTLLDRGSPMPRRTGAGILVADLHVHPYPGDGSLPVWELQREAARRGIDVIGVTGHNNRAGLVLGRLVPLDPRGPIVLPGQEVTTPGFHLIAVGIDRLIDWRLSARDAIAAIHAQGGVAIAAHPAPVSWQVTDEEALRALDGAEVAHPVAQAVASWGVDLQEFFARLQAVNPRVAPIGSTDFHMAAPLGLCRTYLLVEERTAAGALEAIRRGRTVAGDARGRLVGEVEHVTAVEQHLASTPPATPVPLPDKLAALGALFALAALTVAGARSQEPGARSWMGTQ